MPQITELGEFRWEEVALTELLHGPHGPVVRDLIRRAILVEAAAKQYARAGHPNHPNVRSGRLWQSITWHAGVDPVSPYIDVGSNVEYAAFVEEGTSRAPAYPYLKPALEAARATF